MNTYSFKVKPQQNVFDKLPLDRYLVLGSSIFLVIVTIGVIYFGRTNYFLAFCIMLSMYGVLLGYLLSRMEHQSQLPNTQTFNYLQLLSTSHPYLEAIVSENKVLYQNKDTDKGNDFTNKTVTELLDELNLHELDKVTLITYLESVTNHPLATIFAQKLESGVEKWVSCSIKPVFTNEGKKIHVLQIEDITSAQQSTQSQQQYIKDMENIIDRNYNPNSSLHLISKMANSRNIQQPLKTIQSYIRLIEKDYKNQLDKKGLDAIRHISSSSYQLETMMEDLFSMTGLNEQKTKAPLVDINEVIEEVQIKYKSQIANTKTQINVNQMPKIRADRNQLYVLFQNLIENAINYCGEQAPVITIDCKQENRHWIISVSDQGLGIGLTEKKHIFDYLNRGQIKSGIKGLGLGLSICKQIVQNYNGDIWVESDGLGKGSSFVFALPVEPSNKLKTKRETMAVPVAVTA